MKYFQVKIKYDKINLKLDKNSIRNKWDFLDYVNAFA